MAFIIRIVLGFALAVVVLSQSADAAEEQAAAIDFEQARETGQRHLLTLAEQPWGELWKTATLTEVRHVLPKEGIQRTGIGPAWWAGVKTTKTENGYLIWNADGDGRLIEFGLDTSGEMKGEGSNVISGVPPLQQFPVTQDDGGKIASGCVPTAGGSVLEFWRTHGHPQWQGEAGEEASADLTKRLRSRLQMTPFPDDFGYSDDKLTLAGAPLPDLAIAIQEDAAECHVPIDVELERFQYERLKSEIDAGRPTILSCTVRLPHRPELSWGHAVAGVGWAEIGDAMFVGVIDNFYPVKHAKSVRWIESDAFDLLIALQPIEQATQPGSN